jgi:hypothetical protein
MELDFFIVHGIFIVVHLNCLYTFVQFAVECIVILFMLQMPYAFSLLQNSVQILEIYPGFWFTVGQV